MSRSNSDKPFYVDVGTSIVAVRCASNHDVLLEYDHSRHPFAIELARTTCDRMNREAGIGRPRRNCDVGTAEEQAERMDAAYCSKRLCAKGKCPLFKPGLDCSLIWAQTPYEAQEGGAK